MNHSPGMSGRQATRSLNCNISRFTNGNRSAGNFARQRFALIKGHHDIGAAVCGLLNSVDHSDVGMIE